MFSSCSCLTLMFWRINFPQLSRDSGVRVKEGRGFQSSLTHFVVRRDGFPTDDFLSSSIKDLWLLVLSILLTLTWDPDTSILWLTLRGEGLLLLVDWRPNEANVLGRCWPGIGLTEDSAFVMTSDGGSEDGVVAVGDKNVLSSPIDSCREWMLLSSCMLEVVSPLVITSYTFVLHSLLLPVK